MGHRALGSLDQRETVDCPMGEGSYTVESYVSNIIRVGAFWGIC